jgi:diguanylate cyclase (GGDEF)-like protein
MARSPIPPVQEHDVYQGPTWWPMSRLLGAWKNAGLRRLALVGVAVNLLSILAGVANVAWHWNGIPVHIGAFSFDVTVYPPLVLSVLTAVWIGPMWGIVPAYLANLASAIWSGIPVPTALLFALAGAIETAILWGSMVTLNIAADLRRARDLLRFAALGLIAPATSSLAILIWNAALGLGFVEGQRIWRGWVIGDFIQLTWVVAPLLRWAGPPVRAWIDRQFATPPRYEASGSRRVMVVVGVFSLTGLLVFAGIGMMRHSLEIDAATRTTRGELLLPRLNEIQFFLGLLVLVLLLATGVFSHELARTSERHRLLARRETLTGLFNRRAFYEFFHREADRSRRLGQGICIVFLDVDHFKPVNDRYGHEVGDRLLQQLAMRLQGVIRETDLLFRWGGEEFVVLLPHTAPADAPALAERVRVAVAERPFSGIGTHPPLVVTISLGTAGSADGMVSPDALIARADEACYRAKHSGRNRVVAGGETAPA